VEQDPIYQGIIDAHRHAPDATTPDAIMAAVHEVTETISARAIICWTKSGSTARRANARVRPSLP
jgi:pyruvate kinase